VNEQAGSSKGNPMNAFISRISLLTVIVSGLAMTPAVADDDADLRKVRETVSAQFEGINPDEIHASDIDGWYTISKGAIIAYISADGRYLLQGDLIDLVEQVNLTEKDRNKARAKMMQDIDETQLIVFTPDTVRHTVSVFTDIDCTFCRRLHNQIDEYMDEGIEVRYFLYPRNGPASPSWTKAEQVWCADDRNEALTAAKQDENFDFSQCDSSIVSTHYAMGQDVGLRGTPAIVLEDGTLFSGYLPPKQLTEAIAATLGE
jgi:thiol:disulfide interchange protein DsbC